MYCNSCGKQLPPGSRFCNYCGATQPESITQGEELQSIPYSQMARDEQVIFVVKPTMVFVLVRYFITALFFVILTTIGVALRDYYNLSPIIATIVGLLAFINPIYHHLRRQGEIYTLTTHKIEFTYGLLGKTTRNIPLSKIQDVTAKATALERLLGIGDIVIDSAAEMGKIPLRKVSNPKMISDAILKALRQQNEK